MVADGLATVIRRRSGRRGRSPACHSGAEALPAGRRDRRPMSWSSTSGSPTSAAWSWSVSCGRMCPSVQPVLISASFTREALDEAVAGRRSTRAGVEARVRRGARPGRAGRGDGYRLRRAPTSMPLLARRRDRHGDGAALSTEREREVIQALADGCDVPDDRGRGCTSASTRCATTSAGRCRSSVSAASSTPSSPRAGSATSRSARERGRPSVPGMLASALDGFERLCDAERRADGDRRAAAGVHHRAACQRGDGATLFGVALARRADPRRVHRPGRAVGTTCRSARGSSRGGPTSTAAGSATGARTVSPIDVQVFGVGLGTRGAAIASRSASFAHTSPSRLRRGFRTPGAPRHGAGRHPRRAAAW